MLRFKVLLLRLAKFGVKGLQRGLLGCKLTRERLHVELEVAQSLSVPFERRPNRFVCAEHP